MSVKRQILVYKLGLQFSDVKQNLEHAWLRQMGKQWGSLAFNVYPVILLLNGLPELQVCIFMLCG